MAWVKGFCDISPLLLFPRSSVYKTEQRLANSVGVAEVFNAMIQLVNELSIENKVLLIRFVASILADYDDRNGIIGKHHKIVVKTSLIIFQKYSKFLLSLLINY